MLATSTSSMPSRGLAVTFFLGLVGFLVVGGDVHGQVAQLTSGVDCGSFAPSTSGDGTSLTFESTCDLTGGNADGNPEIFQITVGGAISQLTDSADCLNVEPSSNTAGDRVAFASDCDHAGNNSDGNFEIFQVRPGTTAQLTDAIGCDSFAPSSNADGTRVVFDSECDHAGGQNTDLSSEIFRITDQGVLTQITDDASLTLCASLTPNSDASGTRVVFESDCDLTGDNAEQVTEVILADEFGALTRITFGNYDCVSSFPVLNDAGDLLAFESDCDHTGTNADGSLEIFTADSAATIGQLTDDDGTALCESFNASLNGSGTVVAFTSSCDLAGNNVDGSFEVFAHDGTSLYQWTAGTDCGFLTPALTSSGLEIVAAGTCNLGNQNGDGSSEIFTITGCPCGAPATRGGSISGLPTASDALKVLQSAVGQSFCRTCVCDANNSGSITSSDALIVLQAAVGQGAALACPAF